MKEVINILNKKKLDEESGLKLSKELARTFNTFGDYEKLAQELYGQLTSDGQKHFKSLFCLIALHFAKEWERSGFQYWDLRKKNSMKFAYEHKEEFEKGFVKLNQFEPFIVTPDPHEGSLSQLNRLGFREHELMEYIGFLYPFADVHPTIQQSFFGGCINGIFAVEMTEKGYFPFI